MEDLLSQIESVNTRHHYLLALFSALTVPDICGAADSSNGTATGIQYKKWFDLWVAPRYLVGGAPTLTGEVCYYYRCSALHQARSAHPRLGYSRIIFAEPRQDLFMHNNVMGDVLNIDVRIFCADMVAGARAWLNHVSTISYVQTNLANGMRRHANGIAPYIDGVPVIG